MSVELSKRTVVDILSWAVDEASRQCGVALYDPAAHQDMKFATDQQMEACPVEWLTYYQSCMSFYNAQHVLWKAAAELLEVKYKSCVDRHVWAMTKNTKIAVNKAELESRITYENLKEAGVIASGKTKKWLANYLAAEGRRDVASRSITARESDRKVVRY